MKNKKIISLICALAMVLSMFAGFSVSAANTKGIDLAATLSEDCKTITVEATAYGTVGALSNFNIAFTVPETATAVAADAGLSTNLADNVAYVAFLDTTGNGKEFADGKLATITVTLSEPVSKATLTLTDDAAIKDSEGSVKVSRGTMDAKSVTVKDPNSTEAAERPAKQSTTEPDVTPTKKGIKLEGSMNDDNTEITVVATAVDTVGALSNFNIAFTVPETATAVTADAGLSTNLADNVAYVAFLDTTGNGQVFADGKLATIKVALSAPLTSATTLKLTDDAAIKDSEGSVKVSRGTMEAASTTVSPAVAEPSGSSKTIGLEDYVASDAADKVAAAEAAGKEVYLTVDAKDEDGNPATYGEDYVAVYNDKVLTEAEYNDLIHGYTDEPMDDVIKGLQFKVYNNGVKTISTTVNAVGDENQLTTPVTDKEVKSGSTTPTTAPKTPAVSAKASKTSVTVGDTPTITITVTNPAADGVLAIYVDEDSYDLLKNSGIKYTDEDGITEKLEAGIWTDVYKPYSFSVPTSDKGTFELKYSYDYTDADGAAQSKTGSVKVKISEKSSSGGSSSSSSSSSSSGNGVIAGPSTSSGVVVGPDGTTSFTDLGSVPWAVSAIYDLAKRGVISGRDEWTFDPNANITRAEYAQILVGALGRMSDSADTYFDDVPTDAWFYHAVAVAAQLGIIEGYGDGNFGPNDLITREQMALMTQKAAIVAGKGLAAQTSASFTDDADIADWAKDAVYTLANAGIINGMDDGSYFAPKANATRAQAAVIVEAAIY